MTHKLETLLNIDPVGEKIEKPPVINELPNINLQEQLADFDKISEALPRVKGLGDLSDSELDNLADKALSSYEDLMDLGMEVEAKYSTRIFEVAATMLNAAIGAKSAKIDKKLKMVELQIKKLSVDKKPGSKSDEITGEAYIVGDRNKILEQLKNLNK
jgi:hypothetical protein